MIRNLKKRLGRSSSTGSNGTSVHTYSSNQVQENVVNVSTHGPLAPEPVSQKQRVVRKKTVRRWDSGSDDSDIDVESILMEKITELSAFDACIEAADALAAAPPAALSDSNILSATRIDPATGLSDPSVLVSPEGDLLLIPQQQVVSADVSFDSNDAKPATSRLQQDLPHDTAFSELLAHAKDEYESAVYLGKDIEGDASWNGFSATGWSIPATTTALVQTEAVMQQMVEYCESIVLARKESAARMNLICNSKSSMGGSAPVILPRATSKADSDWAEPVAASAFEVTARRVGPFEDPNSTVQQAFLALEDYYSMSAEQDAQKWRTATLTSADPSGTPVKSRKNQKAPGILPALQTAVHNLQERSQKRLSAIQKINVQIRFREERLDRLKKLSAAKWKAVIDTEELVTKKVEAIMKERSKQRARHHMEQLRNQEQKAQLSRKSGDLGTTSEEIWDIVSAVARSMEDGSFEPMDLPSAPLTAPQDKSFDDSCSVHSSAEESDKEGSTVTASTSESLPVVSREQIELEFRLPELRAEAMKTDDDMHDAADALLNTLSNLDTLRRSAKVAAETCLLSAGNAQAKCIKAMVKLEREMLEARLRNLEELEDIVEKMDVRDDIANYIHADKKDCGGSSCLGDDDDGGVASALAVLSSHVDGNSYGSSPTFSRRNSTGNSSYSEEESATPIMIELALEKFLQENEAFRSNDPNSTEFVKAKTELEESFTFLCKIASDSTGRARRSSICYSLNSKRGSHAQVPSLVQFEALCKLFSAILSQCEADEGGVSNAKMCMMLAQTFYIVSDEVGQGELDSTNESQGSRDGRVYVKSRLTDHSLWANDEFWDEALSQQISDSLRHSGVMSNFEKNNRKADRRRKSEWMDHRKIRWHDLSPEERMEAASQVHAVVFAQLGALAHSMMEFGCGLERSCAFVRRMSVRNQLPLSQRTMLLQHLMKRHNVSLFENANVNDSTTIPVWNEEKL